MINNRFDIQQARIRELTLLLRNSYYKSNNKFFGSYPIPYGGNITESIGAWPEYILKGTFCKRSFNGLCSPCFYSRLPLNGHKREEYLSMIHDQCMYIVNNFKELVIDRQIGRTLIENQQHSGTPCSLVLTPTGSYFDNYEFPIEIRLKMLEGLVHQADKYDVDIVLHIETHCDDFNEYILTNNDALQEIELLKQLNAKVIFGFESANEYVRNVLYNKKLSQIDFERAINKIISLGLTPGAFVFAGLFAMNDKNTILDIQNTVKYLSSYGVMPVLMFQNVQEYTLTDILFKNNEIYLLEPFTVLQIVTEFLKELQKSKMQMHWLIADPVGGPPKPEFNIFDCAANTCEKCSKKIYELLKELRLNRDIDTFLTKAQQVQKCSCYSSYLEFLSTQDSTFDGLITNTERLIDKAQNLIYSYIDEKSVLGG